MTPDDLKHAVVGVATAVVLALTFGAGWLVSDMRSTAEAATVARDAAIVDAGANRKALDDLASDAKAVHAAAEELGAIKLDIGPKLAAISRDVKQNAKPLPPDCRPDAVRVRGLDASIDTANAAIARAGARGAVPANP